MNNMNQHELTAEQRELLEYAMKPRSCTRCNEPIQTTPGMIDVSDLTALLRVSPSLSDVKQAMDTSPAFCPKCSAANHARAQRRWGMSSDVGGDQGSVVEFSPSEIYDICTAIRESLGDRMWRRKFVEEYGKTDWQVCKMALPYGGWFILEKPCFEKEPDSLPPLDQQSLKLFWRLQNLLIEAHGGVPISASEFFPTKQLREWGQQYERQVGIDVQA